MRIELIDGEEGRRKCHQEEVAQQIGGRGWRQMGQNCPRRTEGVENAVKRGVGRISKCRCGHSLCRGSEAMSLTVDNKYGGMIRMLF